MVPTMMTLKILLPFQIFSDLSDVKRIVAETQMGFFGLLPQRLDCVATLVPGILVYETSSEGEIYLAVDEGVLVKTGNEVLISTHRAIQGSDLNQLQRMVEKEYLNFDEREQKVREVSRKLEAVFLQRFRRMKNE